jgi:hypothetical protein
MPLHHQILVFLIVYALGLLAVVLFMRGAKDLSHCETDGDYLIDAEPERNTAFTCRLQVKDGVGRIVPRRST